MILGFGSTESSIMKTVEKDIEQLFVDNISINDEWIKEQEMIKFEEKLKEYFTEIANEYEKYDKMEKSKQPERYWKVSSYPVVVTSKGHFLFVHIKFWFINTRHPFSPDGVALLQEPKTFVFSNDPYDVN